MKKVLCLLLMLPFAAAYGQLSDTLVLNAEKQAILQELRIGFVGGSSKKNWGSDLVPFLPKLKNIPRSLKRVTQHNLCLNRPQLLYLAYKAGKIDSLWFKENNRDSGTLSDTTKYWPEPIRQTLFWVMGEKRGRTCFCFDTDNDQDMTGEKIHILTDSGQDTVDKEIRILTDEEPPVKVLFERPTENGIVTDSTWIALSVCKYPTKQEYLSLEIREHTVVSLTVDDVTYTFRIFPSMLPFYDQSARIEIEGNELKQTIYQGEICELGNEYYRIGKISPDGRRIELYKLNVDKKPEVMQVNFPPFSFENTTLEGDTISFPEDFKGKLILVEGYSPLSYRPDFMKYLYEKYRDKGFEIVTIVPSRFEALWLRKEKHASWPLILDEDRKITEKYGQHYCPIFLLGRNGLILNKDFRLGLDAYLEELIKENLEK